MQLSDLCIFTEPQQGASYDTLLAVAQRAETLGFGGFFRSDHFLVMGEASGLPGPTDAWVTLAGLARETSTIRLGTLVTPVTFRGPGLLAISVAQVDQMSGGRIELGIGAGWYEAEHTAYGFDFPDAPARFDNLTDQLAIIEGLWSTPVGETFSYAGTVHSVTNSPGLPKPVQQPCADHHRWRRPVTHACAGARYATRVQRRVSRSVATFIEAQGSRRGSMRSDRSATARCATRRHSTVCAGATDADVARRAAAIGRDARRPSQERCGRLGR